MNVRQDRMLSRNVLRQMQTKQVAFQMP